jgi:hydroxymethylpyrimidine/phosphomethylpyrimidine kinase
MTTALAIAGSDSGGGAGIQADLKAMAAVGVHGATAITSVTSQNTLGVDRVDPLPVEGVLAQIDAVAGDLDVQAVKTGMLHTPAVVEAVADRLAAEDVPVVVDPVMVATSGDALSEGDLPRALAKLAAETTLLTPNIDECEMLLDREVNTLADAREAGHALREEGWANVLVKGGHLATEQAVDLLVGADGVTELAYPRVDGTLHGAGCTYSSLIAGLLARGHELEPAVREARARMHRAIQHRYEPGEGSAVLDALEHRQPGPAEGQALSQAAWRIGARLDEALVPEVGINLAHAPADADDPADVLGLGRRITPAAGGPSPPGPVIEGGSGHVARALLAARHVQPDTRAAMNLARPDGTVAAAEAAGLTVEAFDRTAEPDEAESTMEWGTTRALKATDADHVDVVTDEGAQGKEPMMRLFATDPDDLVAEVTAIQDQL